MNIVVDHMLERGVSTAPGMEDRAAVLFRLLRNGDPSAVISFFRDLTVSFDINLIHDEEGFGAIHQVAQANNDELCRVFLAEAGEDLDVNLRSKNSGLCTALHLAASVGNNFAVERLLQRGANTACPDGYGQCPYDVAELHGHFDTAFILLQESESPRESRGRGNRGVQWLRNKGLCLGA